VSNADPIPAVFAPIRHLRNGPKFADLEMHHFTPEEMIAEQYVSTYMGPTL
jgi:hypothetical protein